MSTLADHAARHSARHAAATARDRLVAGGVSVRDARMDAELLARHVLGWDRAAWLTRADQPASAAFLDAYARLIERRARREPIAYITGTREFYGREFHVSPAVLIPRPETELIVDVVLQRVSSETRARLVDVGTGSGALAVTLAAERPGLHVQATDVSAAALVMARWNAARHAVGTRVVFHEGDLLLPTTGRFDVIVSNPPYVARRDAPGMSPQVRDYEPSVALFGGEDGLALVNRLLGQIAGRLAPGGWLAMEFGDGQEDRAVQAAAHAGLRVEQVLADLQGIPRVLVACGP